MSIDALREPRPWGWLCGLGVIVCIGTLYPLFLAYVFRFDSEDEYREVLQLDGILGAIFAFGVLLITMPHSGTWPWRLKPSVATIWLVPVFAIWLIIGGGMLWHHYSVHLIRSGVSR